MTAHISIVRSLLVGQPKIATAHPRTGKGRRRATTGVQGTGAHGTRQTKKPTLELMIPGYPPFNHGTKPPPALSDLLSGELDLVGRWAGRSLATDRRRWVFVRFDV
ncbi:hypothetical protein HYQ46_010903 [Verticillium longisporum]|nr:hypothetical protein HYQ46_010903 [Verticillium longisporum]